LVQGSQSTTAKSYVWLRNIWFHDIKIRRCEILRVRAYARPPMSQIARSQIGRCRPIFSRSCVIDLLLLNSTSIDLCCCKSHR